MKIINRFLAVLALCLLPLPAAGEPYWIKILNYHEIFPESWMQSTDPKLNRFTKPSDRLLIVTAENLEKQIEYVSRNYKLVTMTDFAEHLEKKQAYEQNVVIITFDGADETIYKYAYPILKKYKAPATLFLHINSMKFDKTAMKWAMVEEMHEGGLIDIESHSISHPHMNRKKANETEEAYEARIRKELADSKALIEEKLKKKVECFAYPYGGYNATVMRLLKETGYKTAVTVQWDKNTIDSNPYALKRRGISGARSLEQFIELFKKKFKDDTREYAD